MVWVGKRQEARGFIVFYTYLLISCYQEITEIDPRNTTAFHRWADALLNLERWQEAIAIYQRAIAINPNFDWSYYNGSRSVLSEQRYYQLLKTVIVNNSIMLFGRQTLFVERSPANRNSLRYILSKLDERVKCDRPIRLR